MKFSVRLAVAALTLSAGAYAQTSQTFRFGEGQSTLPSGNTHAAPAAQAPQAPQVQQQQQPQAQTAEQPAPAPSKARPKHKTSHHRHHRGHVKQPDMYAHS